MRVTLKLVAVGSVLAAPLAAQRGRPEPTRLPAGWQAFTQTFDRYVSQDSIVGASVLLLQDGRVAVRHDVGLGDRALGQRTDTNTIYHWASITKTLTAVAIMQLRDRGKLSLDDRVTSYLPELRQVHNPYGTMDDITIRMLLSHAAGFQDPTWPYRRGMPWEPFEPTRWEQLVAMMPYQELRFRPGSQYGYSNPGFIYLARIIEQLTGDSWQTYVYKNLFAPLGLTRSYFAATPYYLAPYRSNNYDVTADSSGHVTVTANGRDFDPGITIPNGGWNAPLGDLALWLRFLTGATGGDSSQARRYDLVLRRSSLEEMWQSRYLAGEPVATPDVPADSIGMSFFVLWRSGARFVGHTGSQAGFRSFFYINPLTRAGVIAAFNTTNDVQPRESAAGFRAVRDSALALMAR
ncbi:MAG TPA: serine hydrolase domain-containing protein [Streptosporangiaceae bacterium]|nr:serine hydrolase domain-containing protein [Streptosporangiaceae bacterium]